MKKRLTKNGTLKASTLLNRHSCEGLDYVEASHQERVPPFIYCHLYLHGHLDTFRLRSAIQRSSYYVPELFCTYDIRCGRFVNKGFSANDVLLSGEHLFTWDLNRLPQIQIRINTQKQQDIIIIGMSHILADGNGFLQYLYLLASLYNDETYTLPCQNQRSLSPLLNHVHIQAQTEQSKYAKNVRTPPLRKNGRASHYFCIVSRIAPGGFSLLHEKTKRRHVTLNDVFLTAYARVIAKRLKIPTVILPCPANLRQYMDETEQLTVANMTGIFRRVPIEVLPQHSFDDTLAQVHLEMLLQKSRYRCLAGILALDRTFHKFPLPLSELAIRSTYHLLPVSYTNMGQIDHNRLFFHGCHITDCYMTGTYRMPPDFQLSVSTFRNVCTLNSAFAGESGDDQKGQELLEQVKAELLEWAAGYESI